jgi:phosphopantothenoylcysteine decarboxylase/phosphopantothenate--cysteine ligase
MFAAVEERIGEADVSVFAAAVADYRASEARDDKMKRSDTGRELAVSLVANPDIAGDTRPLRREGSVTVGFALETSNLLENAGKKLAAKGFDLLVANDATEEGAGFEVETNRVTILTTDAPPEKLPIASKDAVAEEILDRVTDRLSGRVATAAPGRATAPDRATARSTHRP